MVFTVHQVLLLSLNHQRQSIKTETENSQIECRPLEVLLTYVMAAMPNIGGALCSTPQSLADAHYQSAVQ